MGLAFLGATLFLLNIIPYSSNKSTAILTSQKHATPQSLSPAMLSPRTGRLWKGCNSGWPLSSVQTCRPLYPRRSAGNPAILLCHLAPLSCGQPMPPRVPALCLGRRIDGVSSIQLPPSPPSLRLGSISRMPLPACRSVVRRQLPA